MSKKTRLTLKAGEIGISDAAQLQLRMLTPPGTIGRVIQHAQRVWAETPRLPGHAIAARIELGPVKLQLIISGRNAYRAVIVTMVENLVMRARALDPNAPGEISALRPASQIAAETKPMSNERDLHVAAGLYLQEAAPELLAEASMSVAVLKDHIKKTGTGSYPTKRWFWNIRGDEPFVLLVALAHTPAHKKDIAIAECFRIPREDLGKKKVQARYKVRACNRVGGFLDQYRVTVPALPSAPATAAPEA